MRRRKCRTETVVVSENRHRANAGVAVDDRLCGSGEVAGQIIAATAQPQPTDIAGAVASVDNPVIRRADRCHTVCGKIIPLQKRPAAIDHHARGVIPYQAVRHFEFDLGGWRPDSLHENTGVVSRDINTGHCGGAVAESCRAEIRVVIVHRHALERAAHPAAAHRHRAVRLDIVEGDAARKLAARHAYRVVCDGS